MAKTTSGKRQIEKFEICFRAYDSPGSNSSREIGFVFDRVGKTANHRPVFVMRNEQTELDVKLPLPEGNYSKLYDLFDAMDPSTAQSYMKKLMALLNFVGV